MPDREQILNRLRSQQREASHRPAWRSRRDFPDLAGQFCAALAAGKGEALQAASLDEALHKLGSLLAEIQAGRVAANADPPLDGIDFPARWPAIQWRSAADGQPGLRDFCAGADAGISTADAALAETGSIVISSGPGKSRLVPLLIPVHIALVPASRLTSDLFTWTAARGGQIPANVTLVSGPSKSADIEQTLAIGVHGPRRLVVILYDA